jgi:predicted lipoprotein with Yx(FWY)xxD motif
MKGLIRFVLPLVLVAAAGAGAAMATTAASKTTATVKLVKTEHYGSVLADASGRILYRYTPDKKNVNTCKTGCAPYWPKALVKATAKLTAGAGVKKAMLGTIKSTGGMRQLTYGGWPLYRYVGDSKAGQLKGQGYEHVWYVVNASGALVKKEIGGGGGGTTTMPATTTSDDTTTSGDAWG